MARILRTLVKKSAKSKAKKKASRKAAKRTGGQRMRASIRRAPVRWRIPPSKRRQYESIFLDQFGKKPKGVTSWTTLAERYPERFRDYVTQAEAEE
jgi:hypothetical protein